MAHPAGLPEQFTCPITGGVMSDPVRLETGVAVQRTAIAEWFLECEPMRSVCIGRCMQSGWVQTHPDSRLSGDPQRGSLS